MNDTLLTESLPVAERPAIFPDDMFPGETEVLEVSTPDVNTFRRAFNALAWYKRMIATADEDEKKVLAKIDEEIVAVRDFYSRKREGTESRVEFWKGELHAMMQALNVTKYSTPYGTSFYKRVKRKEWLMDDAGLLAFAKSTPDPTSLVRVKEYPDKKQIEAYVEATGAEGVLTITEGEEVQFHLKDAE